MYVCQLYPAIIKIQLKAKKFNQSGFFHKWRYNDNFIYACNIIKEFVFWHQNIYIQASHLSIIFSNPELDSKRPYQYECIGIYKNMQLLKDKLNERLR